MPSINDEMATSGDIDYSDFEYQFVTATTNEGGDFNFSFEPLLGRGGLDNNELAELVYIETQVSMEFEQGSSNPDQDIATSEEVRGLIGANLQGGGGVGGRGQRVPASTGTGGADVLTDDRVFQIFEARGAPGFDDTTSGAGGNMFTTSNVYTKNWRQLTGRGPVLDSSDDIVLDGTGIVGDSLGGIFRHTIRAHFVWDTAEVSDAGRAFSVPGM